MPLAPFKNQNILNQDLKKQRCNKKIQDIIDPRDKQYALFMVDFSLILPLKDLFQFYFFPL